MSDTTATAAGAVEASFERIDADQRAGIWIELLDREVVAKAARRVDDRVASGERLPLAGVTMAAKGNIALAGLRTTAGCPSYGSVAMRSAPVVEALEDAGAVVVGVTNLDQFATGLVGTRSPHGICPNAHWPGYISGGSSSGSAVAVATGMVDLALGTDTAGSGRVPAAANGIVGLKPTRGWLSAAGVVPACRSLDCVSILARTVHEAARAVRIAGAAGDEGADAWRRLPTPSDPLGRPMRIGVPAVGDLWFDGDPDGPAAFTTALEQLVRAVTAAAPGTEFVAIDVAPFIETGALLYDGAFVAERFDAVGPFISSGAAGIDPVVHGIIARSEALSAWEVFRDLDRLQAFRQATAPTWSQVDAFVLPSIPRLPKVVEVRSDPIGVNAMLGTYTNFVNLLDLAAITVPVDVAGTGPIAEATGRPASLTVVGPAWSDERLVGIVGSLAGPTTRS